MKTYFIIILFTLGYPFTVSAQSLDDYLLIAAENNPGLQAKYKLFESAMEHVTMVGNLPDPNLSFGYFISPIETRVGPQRARFSLTQMFPWFGTLKAQQDEAALLAEAKYHAFLDAKNKLFYQVSEAYYVLYELQKLSEIEGENITILSSYHELTMRKFQNGIGSMVDVLRVEIMLEDAKTNLSILKDKKAPLETKFNVLLNREGNTPIIIQDTILILSNDSNYEKDSILMNPLLQELDLKASASYAREQAILKQGMPKIGVGLDYMMIGQQSGMTVSDNGKDAIMPMVTVSLPIFREKYKAAEKESRLMAESYELQKEEVSNRLISSYEMAWFNVKKQSEYSALYDKQINSSQQSLNLIISAYSNSGKEFEEVLRMQQQILKYQKLKTTAVSEYWIAVAELDYITAKWSNYGS